MLFRLLRCGEIIGVRHILREPTDNPPADARAGRESRSAAQRECSGTPKPTVQHETANNSDDSPADGIQGDHADQQECEHHQGSAALTVAVSPCDHNSGNADQKCNGEEHSAGLREPKPVTEPSPIASESRHA
jgi:hypothetical protein